MYLQLVAHSNCPPLRRCFCGISCVCIGRGTFITRPFVLVVCPLVREIQSPPLHKDSLHLGRFANIQCMLLLRIVRIHKAQGQAVNGIGWDDNTERLLEPENGMWQVTLVAFFVEKKATETASKTGQGTKLAVHCHQVDKICSPPQRPGWFRASYSRNFSQESPATILFHRKFTLSE